MLHAMAKNRYNFNTPAALQDREGALPGNSRVSASPTYGAQNAAVQTTVSRQSGEVSVKGVRLQVRNAAVREEVTAGQINFSATSKAGGAEANDPHLLQVTAGEGGPVPHPSQVPVLPASRNGASYAGSTSQTTAPLAIASGERRLVPQTSQVDAPQNGDAQILPNLQRTGVGSKQVAEVKLAETHIKAGNVAAGAIRKEELVAGERKVVHQEIEVTDDGKYALREYVRTERYFYCRVFEVFYFAALNEPEEPPEPSNKEKCVDYCCQYALSCNFLKIARRRSPEDGELKSAFKRIDYMTPVLRRGRAKGWVVHTDMIFPLVKNTFRNVWVGAELLLVLIALSLSITSSSLGKNKIFNILHLVLTILGSVLAIIDGVILLYGCSLFKLCGAVCEHDKEETVNDQLREHLLDERDPEDTSNSESKGGCKQCINSTRNMFDISRMIVSELIFYPLLICDIFEVITGKVYQFNNKEKDIISFILIIVSLILVLIFVYIVRIVIVVAANYHSQKRRDEAEDHNIRKSAFYFQGYFIFHVIAQMVAQILMIIAIGAVIYQENEQRMNDMQNSTRMNHLQNETLLFNGSGINEMQIENLSLYIENGSGIYDMIIMIENISNSTGDVSIQISNCLWYMLVAGYILPIYGLLTFFIVMYFWVQEFPIGICIDVLSIFKRRDIDDTLEFKATVKEVREKLDKINKYIHLSELKKQFKGLQNTAWFNKFSYPFQSPQMVILCLIYAYLQLSFVIIAGINSGALKSSDDGSEAGSDAGSDTNSISYLNGTGIIYGYSFVAFSVFAIIVGIIANIYVFAVALVWSVIIVSILALIATLIFFLICCCIFCVCISSDNNRRHSSRRVHYY